jgi:hypothetical protein
MDAMSETGANVHILQTATDHSADVRKALADSVDFINQLHGAHFAGFAIVGWDTWGNSVPVSFHGKASPLGDDLVATYVMNALSQQNILLKMTELQDEPKPKE